MHNPKIVNLRQSGFVGISCCSTLHSVVSHNNDQQLLYKYFVSLLVWLPKSVGSSLSYLLAIIQDIYLFEWFWVGSWFVVIVSFCFYLHCCYWYGLLISFHLMIWFSFGIWAYTHMHACTYVCMCIWYDDMSQPIKWWRRLGSQLIWVWYLMFANFSATNFVGFIGEITRNHLFDWHTFALRWRSCWFDVGTVHRYSESLSKVFFLFYFLLQNLCWKADDALYWQAVVIGGSERKFFL